MAISQSGETADTLAAIDELKRRSVPVLGLVNVVGSSIARAVDGGVYLHAGPEISVASTKAFTGQVTVLTMLALTLGRLKKTLRLNSLRSKPIWPHLKKRKLRVQSELTLFCLRKLSPLPSAL